MSLDIVTLAHHCYSLASPTDPYISESKFLFDLGAVLFKALYYGLAESEVRELQPALEELLDRLTYEADLPAHDGASCDSQEENTHEKSHEASSPIHCDSTMNTPPEPVTLESIKHLCINHLADARDADRYYQDLCSALYAEANLDLKLLLKVASSGKSIGDEMDAYNESASEAIREDVKFQEWACLWIQVVRDLKDGVKLRKVNVNYNKSIDDYDLTPYEMLLRDIRDKNYNLRHIDSEAIEKMKKDTHALILELIRTRPKLVPASQRILRPEPVKISTIHEKLMQEVRSCPKLRHIGDSSSTSSSMTIIPICNTNSSTMYNIQQRVLNLRESPSPSPKRRLIKADIDLTLSCSIDAQQLNHKNIDDDNLLNNVNDKASYISTLHNGTQRVMNNNVNINNNNNHNNRSHDRKNTSLLYKAFARILNLDIRY